MADSTQTSTQDAMAALGITIPTGQEIYDYLMAKIEPELVTSAIPTLDEKYKGETPEEKTERKQRYKVSFEKYHKAFDEWLAELKAKVDEARKNVLRAAEKETRGEEVKLLEELEMSFDTTSNPQETQNPLPPSL